MEGRSRDFTRLQERPWQRRRNELWDSHPGRRSHPFVTVAEDDHGPVQIVNIENNDSVHDLEHSDELVHRPRHLPEGHSPLSVSSDSVTSVETIELPLVRCIHRRHSHPHFHDRYDRQEVHADSHSPSGALGLAHADGQLYGRQIAEQTQNLIIHPDEWGGKGRYAGPREWDYYRPWDPYGPPRDHWEIAEERMRAKIKQEEREIEGKIDKAILEYKDKEERHRKEIKAAVDKHDLELAAQKAKEKAAVEAALKKKYEEERAWIKRKEDEEEEELDLYFKHRHGLVNCETKLWVEGNRGRRYIVRSPGSRRR